MPTAFTKRLIIVVTAAQQAAANVQAKTVDTVGGDRTFTVGLNPTGRLADAATHHWCSWAMQPADATSLQTGLPTAVGAGNVWIFDGTVTTPDQVLTNLGLQRRV
jgi:hypothetical protein